MSNICIAVLLGIPGAGKTHFCKYLKDNLQLNNAETVFVSYDEYEQNLPLTIYKNFRNNVYEIVDALLKKQIENNADNNKKIIIIDDNMYYRSMRRKYYNLAKKYNCSFCQIYIKCDINTASSRNNLRQNSVPSEIIYKMFKKLEPPSTKNVWEQNFCEIDSDKLYNEQDIKIVQDLITEAMKNPIESHSQEIFVHTPSLIHKIDLMLRKIVSHKIKDVILANNSKNVLEMMSQNLLSKKKFVIDSLKNNELFLPDYENDEQLENILHEFIEL